MLYAGVPNHWTRKWTGMVEWTTEWTVEWKEISKTCFRSNKQLLHGY